jgi:hypothetical protein
MHHTLHTIHHAPYTPCYLLGVVPTVHLRGVEHMVKNWRRGRREEREGRRERGEREERGERGKRGEGGGELEERGEERGGEREERGERRGEGGEERGGEVRDWWK